MSTHIQFSDFALTNYLRSISEIEHPILAAIRQQTESHRLGKMAIAPEQAQLLTWLARLIQAKRYLEIGVFTGYSSTAMALALPDDAEITACDINVSFTNIAQQHWQEAGVAHKITLHLQPALFTLDELIDSGRTGYYDLAFIDADKPPTPQYTERCLKLVRSGGIIAIDNLLLGGRVFDQKAVESPNAPPSLAVLREFNASLPKDSRFIPITLPIGDGLTLLLKT